MANYDITTTKTAKEFDTVQAYNNFSIAIDSNHFINLWASTTTGYGTVQSFAVSTTTWAVTTASSSLRFDTSSSADHSAILFDSNHFINFWGGGGSYLGEAQVFAVNTSTWAVTTAGALFNFDTYKAIYHSACVIDDNHFINFWFRNDNVGVATTFSVNTTTWAVTTASSNLIFDTQDGAYNSSVKIDSNHFLNVWQNNANYAVAQVFAVNTSTWAVTTAGAIFTIDTATSTYFKTVSADNSNHVLLFYRGADNDGFATTLAVNTSTWAVTTASDKIEFDTANGAYYSTVKVSDGYYVTFWIGGKVQTFNVNTTTWAVTTASSVLNFSSTGNYNGCCLFDTGKIANCFSGTDADGFAQVFNVELPAVITFIPQITFI